MALDRMTVISAGVTVAEKRGLGAVGMRTVAAELAVTPMALYRHVDGAAALRDAVVAALIADLPSVCDHGSWQARCRGWAFSAHRIVGRADGLAAHVLRNWVRLPPVLIALDSLVVMLDTDGPVGIYSVAAANALLMHVLMRAQSEEVVRDAGLTRDLGVMRSMSTTVPTLWDRRDEYRIARIDEHFTYALDALVKGLHAARRA